MHFSSFFTSLLVVAPLVAAHGDGHIPGAPRLWGRRSAGPRPNPHHAKRVPSHPHHMHKRSQLNERANTDGQCGSGFGNCAAGYCCSSSGWCGTGNDYCAAPDCQLSYGPGCDANKIPPGSSTSGVARTQVGNVPYSGDGIYACTVPGTVALTYDDGPYIYTDAMLDILKKYNVPATFFITGNNLGKGEIDNAYYPWVNVIKRMEAEGHQIASHTWSHQDLSAITATQRLNQMYYNEMAFRNILGYFPTYMRPPYSSCSAASGCVKAMLNLGYHVTYFDLDTEDYLNTLPTQIQTAKNDWIGNLTTRDPSTGNWLEIAHDIHQQTALNLTEYMVTTGLAKGWKFVTVGDCLGDPKANWYRSASGGGIFTSAPSGAAATSAASTKTSSAIASPTAVSDDGSCGPFNGRTCLNSGFGNCCSTSGYCGSDTPYCGSGCQPLFGNCGSNNPGSSSGTVKASSASSKSTSAAPAPTTISQDGNCGAASGQTCLGSAFGNCCSPAGYCGSDTPYCGAGCQSLYGNCGSNNPSSSSSSKISTSTSSKAAGSSSSSSSVASASKSSSSVVSSSSSVSSKSSSVPAGSASSTSSSIVVPSSSSTSSVVVSSSSSKASSMPSSTSVVGAASLSSSSSTSSKASSSLLSSSSSTKSSSSASSISSSTINSSSAKASSSSSSSSSSVSSKSSTSSPAAPNPSLKVSDNAKCGAASKQTCQGSIFGNCCSASGWCGSSDPYCGTGCQAGFGTCGVGAASAGGASTTLATSLSSSKAVVVSGAKSSSASSTVHTSSSQTRSTAPSGVALAVSSNGSCGKAAGATCDGYKGGGCCGSNNKCTDDIWMCFQFLGCQDDYGNCWNF